MIFALLVLESPLTQTDAILIAIKKIILLLRISILNPYLFDIRPVEIFKVTKG